MENVLCQSFLDQFLLNFLKESFPDRSTRFATERAFAARDACGNMQDAEIAATVASAEIELYIVFSQHFYHRRISNGAGR